jgi:preprotein translocase subunit SecA
LAGPQRSIEELTRLSEILRKAQASGAAREEVAEQIKTELPALASLAQLLPSNKSELYGFLAVVLAAVQLYLTVSPPTSQSPVQINVNQVIEQTYADSSPRRKSEKPKSTKKKVGRNAPCPCGSGAKYKKCCGRLQ